MKELILENAEEVDGSAELVLFPKEDVDVV